MNNQYQWPAHIYHSDVAAGAGKDVDSTIQTEPCLIMLKMPPSFIHCNPCMHHILVICDSTHFLCCDARDVSSSIQEEVRQLSDY